MLYLAALRLGVARGDTQRPLSLLWHPERTYGTLWIYVLMQPYCASYLAAICLGLSGMIPNAPCHSYDTQSAPIALCGVIYMCSLFYMLYLVPLHWEGLSGDGNI
jgi:hypothetical protein